MTKDSSHNQLVVGGDGRIRVWLGDEGRFDGIFEAHERHLAERHLAAIERGAVKRAPVSAPSRKSYAVSQQESFDTYHPKRFADGWRVWSPRHGQYMGPRKSLAAALKFAEGLKREDDSGRALDAGSQIGLFERRNGRSRVRVLLF